jgi:hypothetical protein
MMGKDEKRQDFFSTMLFYTAIYRLCFTLPKVGKQIKEILTTKLQK